MGVELHTLSLAYVGKDGDLIMSNLSHRSRLSQTFLTIGVSRVSDAL